MALVLIPEGAARLPQPLVATALVLAGGTAFMLLDRGLAKRRRAAPQFIAMAADFLPESLALGGMFAADAGGAVLLALLMGLQNLPEGFNAWRELAGHGRPWRRATPDADARAARSGVRHDRLAVAGRSGGRGGRHHAVRRRRIVYLTFQDIAPQARMARHWTPPLGAVLGFGLALAGELAFK